MVSEEKVTKADKYREGSESLRHYSARILEIRALVVVQGLVVMGGMFYLPQNNNHIYFIYLVIILSIFGILFTSILYSTHSIYLRDFESVLDYVVKIECGDGSWTYYKRERDARLLKWYTRPLFHQGVFTLWIFSFLSSLIYGVIHLVGW